MEVFYNMVIALTKWVQRMGNKIIAGEKFKEAIGQSCGGIMFLYICNHPYYDRRSRQRGDHRGTDDDKEDSTGLL